MPAGEKGLLCAEGRFGFGETQSKSRVIKPMVKQNEKLVAAGFNEAINTFAEKINEVIRQFGSESVGVAISERFTTEEAYLASKLAREVIHTNNVFTFAVNEKRILNSLGTDKTAEIFTKLFGDSFNRGANFFGFSELLDIKPADDISSLKALVIFGDDMPKVLQPFEFLAVIGNFISKAAVHADLFLPASAFAETSGTYCGSAGNILYVNKATEPKNGIETWALIQKLAASVDENAFCFTSVGEITSSLMKR